MNNRTLRIWVMVASLFGLLALLLTGCAPAAAPVAAPTAPPAAGVAASSGLSTLHFFYTDW